MADTTIGFKGSQDFKEKIDTLVQESGLDKKEWIQHVVSIYELQELKKEEGLKKYEGDLLALEEHTSRINEIFTSFTKKLLDEQKNSTFDFENLKQEKDKRINLLTHQLEGLQQEYQDKIKEMNKRLEEQAEIKKQLVHLEELNDSRKDLIDEKQKEVDRLNQLISEYQAKLSDERLKQLESQNQELGKQLELIKAQHQVELYKVQSEFQKEISQLQEKHAEEIKVLINPRKTPKTQQSDDHPKRRGRPPKNVEVEPQLEEFTYTPIQGVHEQKNEENDTDQTE